MTDTTNDTRETHTTQLWPSGRSVTYRGTEYAADIRDGDTWRPATPGEQRDLRIELRAQRYAERDILAMDTPLVSDLIEAAGSGDVRGDLGTAFSLDEIRGLYADPSEWGLEECREYLSDNGIEEPTEGNVWKMDRYDLIEQLTNAGIETRDDETNEALREAVIVNIDDETIDGIEDWRGFCRGHAQENPAEVLEWWRVSSWLCARLAEIGEVTIDNGYGHWWGRTCSGQAYIMDGTLQAIAATAERDE